MQRGAIGLHLIQLMPLPPHHLLLQQNPEWFTFLVPAYPGCPGKRRLNGCNSSSSVIRIGLVLRIVFLRKSCLWSATDKGHRAVFPILGAAAQMLAVTFISVSDLS